MNMPNVPKGFSKVVSDIFLQKMKDDIKSLIKASSKLEQRIENLEKIIKEISLKSPQDDGKKFDLSKEIISLFNPYICSVKPETKEWTELTTLRTNVLHLINVDKNIKK